MTLAPTLNPLADLVADLLRRTADAISPPRQAARPLPSIAPAGYEPAKYDQDRDRIVLSAEFRNRLPAHIRRDLGIDL